MRTSGTLQPRRGPAEQYRGPQVNREDAERGDIGGGPQASVAGEAGRAEQAEQQRAARGRRGDSLVRPAQVAQLLVGVRAVRLEEALAGADAPLQRPRDRK